MFFKLMQDGEIFYNGLEIVEGMKVDRGYISPYFCHGPENWKCVSLSSLSLSPSAPSIVIQ